MSVSGDGISALGTRQLGSQHLCQLWRVIHPRGRRVAALRRSAARTPTSTTDRRTSSGVSTIAYMLIGAGLLAIGAAFGFFMRERTSARPAANRKANLKPNALIKQIADLDVSYQNGEIAEANIRSSAARSRRGWLR